MSAPETVSYPGDVGMTINGEFKWSKDMTREELLRLVNALRAESEWRRVAAHDAFDLLKQVSARLGGVT